MGVSGQRHAPAALCPGERAPGTHCTGGWVDPRAGLDTEVKRKNPLPLPGIEPRSPRRPVRSQTLYWLSSPAPPCPPQMCVYINIYIYIYLGDMYLCVCMCMYVCMYIYIYIYIYIHIYIYIYTHIISGKHKDRTFGRGGGGVSYINARKKVPERRSGLRASEKELLEGCSSTFCHKNTPIYIWWLKSWIFI
jgi:hypothetical protein